MPDAYINESTFFKKLSIIQKNITKHDFSGVCVIVGAREYENTYKKSTVIQTWLLGFEFVHTAIYIFNEKCIFITSENKSSYLRHLAKNESKEQIEIWIRNKDPNENKEQFRKLINTFGKSDKSWGFLLKDEYKGKIIDEWKEVITELKLDFKDCSLLFSESMEIKNDEEINNTNLASNTSVVMMDIFVDEMMTIIDDQKKITNLKVTDLIEDKLEKDNWVTKSSLGKKLLLLQKKFDLNQLEWCYSPTVQSGGDYDLRPSAVSTDKELVGDGVILISLGLRYKSYCSNIGRTFLFNSTAKIENNYDFLLKLQEHIIKNLMIDGQKAKTVHSGALDYIKKNKENLTSHFTKNCGWLIGVEFRDSTFLLNSKNERLLKNGQIFSLTIGFNDLINEGFKSPNQKNYSLLLSDTIKINDNEPILMTNYTKNRSDISFFFNDETTNSQQESNNKVKLDINLEKKIKSNDSNSKVLKSKLRNESIKSVDDTNAEKRREESQLKLHQKRMQEGLNRFSKADATDISEDKPTFEKYESYTREKQIPFFDDLNIHVDHKNQTILLPIFGRPVPFHINSFKSGSHNEENEYIHLRLNFNFPGTGGNVSKKIEFPYEDGDNFSFLKSITFRSKNHQRVLDLYKEIQTLKKNVVRKDLEKKQLLDVVSQAHLIESKGMRIKKLDQVFIRPQIDTKKSTGNLQIHENGLRYVFNFKSEKHIDILFSNIKHLFFQSCKDELIVIIHCHLKNSVIIGKKKVQDIQFYRETTEIAFDETGNRKRKFRYGDEDELEEEQEERRKRSLLDKEFKLFAELISESSKGYVELDIPFRELGFEGVPFRSAVLCIPTRDCLIQLIDHPFLVITLDEIEIVHLERVQFGLKYFDMVFVFKNFSKPVVTINNISVNLFEDIKYWLTDIDIPYSEGLMKLNWGEIMKTISSDPYQFFSDGGWNFLTGGGETSSEDESEFKVSDEDFSNDDESSDNDDYESDSTNSKSDYDETDEGEDWDELEKKAAKEDMSRSKN